MRHLFRVAASLDSMVVGEPQILGQVKEAYGVASAAESAGAFISRLCNRAFATAKRVRTETEIAKGAGSVSQVAVELVEKIFGDLKGRAVLLVGAGKMGALSAKALRDLGADRLLVANRSPERAAALAAEVGGQAEPWEALHGLLAVADVVIVSTGAPSYVITRELAAHVMKARRQRSICFIDLAVPRNVDPACGELSNVYAYDIDDLQKVVTQTHAARAEEAIRAEAIVEAEVMAFSRERETRAALPVLAALRRRAEEIARGRGRADARPRRRAPRREGPPQRRGHGPGHREQAPPRPHGAPQGGGRLRRQRPPRGRRRALRRGGGTGGAPAPGHRRPGGRAPGAPSMTVRIATRRSALAKWQANHVASLLRDREEPASTSDCSSS